MWLTNCQLVDVETGSVQPSAAVEIQGDRITSVLTGPADRPAGEQVYDLGGRFLMPGIISCHTHLSVVFPFDATDEHESAGLSAVRAAARAKDALQAGITTIRCVHEMNRADLVLRQSAREGWLRIPRIFGAGQALSTTGGHGSGSGCTYVDGADQFLAAARAELAAGADHIKVFITGGLAHAGEVMTGMQVTAAEVGGAVRAASEKGTYVVAHAANSAAIREALQAGVRSFEHAYELDDETARAIAAQGAFLTPTLCVTRMPQWMRDHAFTADQVERAMAAGPQHLDSIKRAVDAGVTLINGTDYPPGEAGDDTVAAIREMEFMAEAGLDPAATLRSVTVNPAKLLSAEHELGQVKPGFLADLIAVDADPTQSVSAIRAVSFVLAAGSVVRDDRPRTQDAASGGS